MNYHFIGSDFFRRFHWLSGIWLLFDLANAFCQKARDCSYQNEASFAYIPLSGAGFLE
jgi:hypothetical protein